MTARSHNASSIVPHFTAMRDVRVAADIAGARFKSDHRFTGTEYSDIEDNEIFGAAIGVPASGGHSMYGVFTDANGNRILVAQESSDRWSALHDKGVAGTSPVVFKFPRLFGDGHGEIDTMTLAGIDVRIEGAASWKDISDLHDENRDAEAKLSLSDNYNNVQLLLDALERKGRKFDETIVVLLSGSPITFNSIVKPFAKLIISAASSVLTLVGLPPSLVQLLGQLVDAAFNGDPISVDSLLKAAQIITPASLRPYIDGGAKLIGSIQKGNYSEAASVLGIDVNNEIRGLLASIEKGDLVQTIVSSAKNYTGLVGSITNALHADVMHKFFSNVTTKSISNAITDAGTTIGIPHMQYLYATLTDPTTIGAITGADGVVETIMKQTHDAETPELLRGFANLLNAKPVGTDTFDALLLRSLKSKANDLASNGKRLVMPLSIPFEKRLNLARRIANDVGVQVVVDSVTTASHYGGFA